ncbi:O-antigen ligase family protein [uncultured Aquimarina sp.]|uniref:O-antigen ligase family protein n=1 Tax=uncultured Aquimarina sp. TaxID=575652 RepID=UPI00262EBA3E|nr:O-antigen ligase family protein [uncultured Aquimarina sp.]
MFFSLAVFFNRASIIISILITLLFALTYLVKHKNWKLITLFLAFFTISTVWILNRPIVKTKFEEIVNTDYLNITDYNNGINSRILSWKCSIENIKNTGFWGHGINNSRSLLRDCYKDIAGENSVPYLEKYNSHNLFLQTTMDLGFVGLGILLLIYFYVLYVGITHRDYLTISYFIVIFIFGLTESFLNRQWGIIFFALFTPFLLNRKIGQ